MRRTSWSGVAVLSAALLSAVVCQADAPKTTPKGVVSGTITLKKDGSPKKDRSGVVVYLEGVQNALPSAISAKSLIHQRDIAFFPEVSVVLKGTTVDFPNDDKVFHNVFSLSTVAKFDLGLYKSGESKSVTFNKVGVADIYCNIHPQMVARVKVIDTTYHALTKADGAFKIDGVPAGTYPVVAWQPYGPEYRGSVTIKEGESKTLAIELSEGERSSSHTKKDGTPYGQYK
jgi:plastocyanin